MIASSFVLSISVRETRRTYRDLVIFNDHHVIGLVNRKLPLATEHNKYGCHGKLTKVIIDCINKQV